MKKAFSFLLQFVMFLLLYALGSFAQFLRLVSWLSWLPVWTAKISATHLLVLDGLIFAALLCILIVIVHALRKRPIVSTWITAGAFVLALLFGLLMKFGFVAIGAAA